MTVLRELQMRPALLQRWGWDASVTGRLVLAGAVIFTLLVGANMATPLYGLLAHRLGLDSLGVTVAFASYVLALIGGLLLAGHWSDYIGRRAALVLAVLIGVAGGIVFANASSLAMLAGGRVLQGLAVALATGASSAALRDLLPTRPDWASRFTLLASAGGVAAGPVLGGLLSLLPDPTRTPFLVQSVALILLLGILLALKARPAIKPAPQGTALATLRPRRPSVSADARGAFWLASLVGFLSFSVFGFCLSLAPGYFASVMHTDARPVVGVLAALTLGSSALSQLLTVRGRHVVPLGLGLLGVSVALIAVAGATGGGALLVLACVGAGAGQGLAFREVFNTVASSVEPARHAQIISAVYVITYLGSAVPVLGMGAAATVWGLPAAVDGFAVLAVAACAALAAAAVRASRT
ncbi:MFS transporter [Pseudarthrobacter sp. P1]|uniref:MFS transporter n=1 Tax=Pseudarthrobacter sp. P1 TaxID=3418418 RepID=UPI003CFB309E